MTVPTTTSAVVYVGTGTTAVYAFTWSIAQASDLIVYTQVVATGVVTQLTLTTNYTVTGVGVPTGGTVTLLAGNLPTGSRVLIASDPAQIQALLLSQANNANQADLMAAYDLLTREVQANRRLINNSFQIPVMESLDGKTVVVPPAVTRANQFLAFDASGNLIVSSGSGGAGVPISSAMTPVVQATSVEIARNLLGNVAAVVDTIAALKALGAAPTTATTYYVRGYYAVGDGGGGFFNWNSADSNADNGGTIIALNLGGTGRFNRILQRRDAICIEEFGGGASQTTNTAQLNAAVAWGAANSIKKILFRAGNYTFNTKPTNFTDGIVLEGCSSSQTNLIRNYSAGSTSEGFFTWYQGLSNGGGLRHLGVYANPSTSNGTLAVFLTGGQVAGYHFLEDVVFSHFGNGDYYCCVEANGVDNTTSGSQGLRDFRMTNCFLFVGQTGTYTMRLVNATNHTVHGSWTNGTIWVTGGGSALTNTTLGLIDMLCISNVIVELCTRVKFYGEYNTMTIQATADTVDLFCRFTTSLTDLGGTNIWKPIPQSFTSSIGASGYQKLPSGLIMQWGTFAATTSFANYTFPIAFPTLVTSIQATATGAGGTSVNVVIGTVSTTQAAIAASTAGNVYVLAFGY